MLTVEVLFSGRHRVVGMLEGGECPAVNFLTTGEKSTEASRNGLAIMLQHVSEHGFHGIPTKWTHEADKNNGIYQFIKGDLRLMFFKGVNGDIAVCADGYVKKGQRVDKPAVARAIAFKKQYESANGLIEYLQG